MCVEFGTKSVLAFTTLPKLHYIFELNHIDGKALLTFMVLKHQT